MLRQYQIDAIDQIRNAVKAGSRRILVVMPTGAGKTRTLGEVVRLSVARGKRALWLAHRAELVDQAVGALSSMGVQCGAVSASALSAPQPFAPVQVATIQTLLARSLTPQADVIVADEAHHYVSDDWHPFIASYPEAVLLGPTATPERSDGRGLGALFNRIVIGARTRELVEAGYLCPAEVIAPAHKLRVGEIAQRPVDAYRVHCHGKRAIVFSPTVQIAERHAGEFRDAGYTAAVVTGVTPWGERQKAFADLRSGALNVLVNVYVATEGFDVPEIECVILARGFGSAGTYLQCVGRALRLAPGKQSATVLDLTGTSHTHGHPEDDRIFSLEGRGIRKGDSTGDQPYCRVCGCPIESGEACPECGTAPREQVDPRVTGAALVRYQSKRREAPEQRAATLRRWLVDAAAKGYKPTWAAVKFKAVYGEWPSGAIKAAAEVGA